MQKETLRTTGCRTYPHYSQSHADTDSVTQCAGPSPPLGVYTTDSEEVWHKRPEVERV